MRRKKEKQWRGRFRISALVWCLFVLLTATVFAPSIKAAEPEIGTGTEDDRSGWEGSLYFAVEQDQAILADCQEDVTSVTIPAEFRGYPVTEIGEEEFAFCENLTKISIPQHIQKIGNGAFSHATKLAKVSFEGGLESIGQEAFAYCYSLKKIELPKGITELPRGIFYQCLSLERVTVPSGVKMVQGGVFANCPMLKAVLLPKTIEKISSYDCFHSGSAYVLYTETEKDPIYQAQDGLGQIDPYYSWWYGGASLYDNENALSVHFVPVAKAPALDKTKKGVLAITWKSRGNSIAGYEIEYARDKSFTKDAKTVKHTLKNPDSSGTDTVKKTLKGVKSKETWYVRIRAYETCSGVKVYGGYSKAKKLVVP